ASYCDVGYFTEEPHPCKEFPRRKYNEPGEPSCVGHIVRDLSPCTSAPLLAYGDAIGRQDVHGAVAQVDDLFLPDLGKKPSGAKTTRYSVSEHDCGIRTIHTSWNDSLGRKKNSNENGARNFLFTDGPPLHRMLNSACTSPLNFAPSFETWNKYLRIDASPFSERHGMPL
ncbi:hypothetical protein BD410DRAFT_855847, partial [Rickenella mellea]